MSKYTSEVRFICENYAGLHESVGYNSTSNVIANARTKIFDFPYPIFDESYRPVLETKILKHFYTREIGAESVGLWKLWLDTRLNEIMPYFNQLYESELLSFNPLYEVDLTRDFTRKTNGTEDGNSKTNSNSVTNETNNEDGNSWNKFSDTPQGGVTGIPEMNYLTNATNINTNNSSTRHNENTGEITGSTKNVIDNTEDYLEHVKGKSSSSSYSKLINEYRQTFLNIDMQVINELNDLFMNLW